MAKLCHEGRGLAHSLGAGPWPMMFAQRLREGVISGRITCSVRIWRRPHVKVGGRYSLGLGAIEVTRLSEIGFEDITPALARRSGFAGVVDLLKIARHGSGERVFLVEFVWRPEEGLIQ